MTKYQHYQCRVLLRVAVMERDKVCQRCGKQIHDTAHVRIVGAWKALEFDLENVIGLCRNCHIWFDNNKEESRVWFAEKWPHRERVLLAAQTRTKTLINIFEVRQRLNESIEISRAIN